MIAPVNGFAVVVVVVLVVSTEDQAMQYRSPVFNTTSSRPRPVGMPQDLDALERLWQRYRAAWAEIGPWSDAWPMDGWLQLAGEPAPIFPVILTAFRCEGVEIVCGLEWPLCPGKQGDLSTHAHGAGCQHRPVRCSSMDGYLFGPSLQLAGLRFRQPG
jgi:hypothetical protein